MGTIKKHSKVAWVDVQNPTEEDFAKLGEHYALHPVHLNESVQKIQLTGVEREDKYIFMLLHVPVQDDAHNKLQVSQIGIFLGKDYLVTIHDGPSQLIDELFDVFEENKEHQNEYAKKGAGYILYGIVRKALDDLSDTCQDVVSELDAIEDLVFDDNTSDAYRIGKVRQRIIKLRRVIGPLRLVLDDLDQQIDSFTGSHLSRQYANNTKTANKLWEIIEEAKETVEIYKDADFTTSTEETNKILAVLTLVFTLTIPVTVMGTIYGMNVPLPGGNEAGPWTFWGHYTTLDIVAIVSVLSAVGMYAYFRRKRWF